MKRISKKVLINKENPKNKWIWIVQSQERHRDTEKS